MIKLNMSQFIDDVRNGVLEQSKTFDGANHGYNLTNYIYNKQPNTKMWHYVNQDVGIFVDDNGEYSYIEDYGNGCPDWAYEVIEDMKKAMQAAKKVTA